MPNVNIVEEQVEVIDEVMVPFETTVQQTFEVPVFREVDVYEDVEIEVPLEKIIEVE